MLAWVWGAAFLLPLRLLNSLTGLVDGAVAAALLVPLPVDGFRNIITEELVALFHADGAAAPSTG